MQKESVIILGHGSKSADAISDFNYIVELTRQKSGNNHVYGAHMELAEPSLEDTIAKVNNLGITRIVILPYFLYNGNHIKEDIPAIISSIQKEYPHMELYFGTPIGKEELMAELMVRKINAYN